MRYYILSIIEKIQQYSKQLDAESALYNKNWIVFSDNSDKDVFIFRPNKELLVSKNGVVTRAKWEFLATKQILLEIDYHIYLFNIAFKDGIFLILQLDGTEEFLIMIDSVSPKKNLQSITQIENDLGAKYIGKFKINDSVVLIETEKQMRIKGITDEGKYECYSNGGFYYEGNFEESELELFEIFYRK